MTEEPATSSRIFIRYGKASADCLPTESDIREIFSVHGNILGMFILKAKIFSAAVVSDMLFCAVC